MVAGANIASHPWQMPFSSVCARTLIRSRANCTKGRQYRKRIQRLWINDLTQRDPMGQQSACSGGRCFSVVRGAASKDQVLRENIPLGRYRMLRPDKMAAPKSRVTKATVSIASIPWPKARSYRSFEGRICCSESQSGGPFIWKHSLVAQTSSLQSSPSPSIKGQGPQRTYCAFPQYYRHPCQACCIKCDLQVA